MSCSTSVPCYSCKTRILILSSQVDPTPDRRGGIGGDFCGAMTYKTAQWAIHTLPGVLRLNLGIIRLSLCIRLSPSVAHTLLVRLHFCFVFAIGDERIIWGIPERGR